MSLKDNGTHITLEVMIYCILVIFDVIIGFYKGAFLTIGFGVLAYLARIMRLLELIWEEVAESRLDGYKIEYIKCKTRVEELERREQKDEA